MNDNTRPPVANFAYKIVSKEMYAAMKDTEYFSGSEMDKRDGFIHLSQSHQVRGTLGRFYAGQYDSIVVLKIDVAALDAFKAGALKYEFGVPRPEGADHDQMFPHLFCELPISAVVDVIPVKEGVDGVHELDLLQP